MAASLLALLDDIAQVLDDVASLTSAAAHKTTGVLGDDLALNAQQVAGVNADRELPVVWAVAKGSLRNKAVLVPAALALSALAPWAVTPLLMLGGTYLCLEGVEKLVHRGDHAADAAASGAALSESDKIEGAVRTDFVLSAEIIAISLGTVAAQALTVQALVLVGIAVVMTVGVYGAVAAIVKLDDAGLWLSRRGSSGLLRALGRGLVRSAPALMKSLTWVGTAAMFLVGGGILTHGWPALHHLVDGLASGPLAGLPGLAAAGPLLLDVVVGVLAGAAALLALRAVHGVRGLFART